MNINKNSGNVPRNVVTWTLRLP